MTKLIFSGIILVGCVFSVSYSRILPPADSNLDVNEKPEVAELQQEQSFGNPVELLDQLNEDREKRSPQNLEGFLGGLSKILEVTSSLANAFKTTRQVITRFRNFTQRICVDCNREGSPNVAPVDTGNSYYYYDDYNDYDLSGLGRKKRTVDSEKKVDATAKTSALARHERLVSGELENFIKIEILKPLRNIGSALRDQVIMLFSEGAKFVVTNFFNCIGSLFGIVRENQSLKVFNRESLEDLRENIEALQRVFKALLATYFSEIRFDLPTFTPREFYVTVNLIRTVFIILGDFIQGDDVIFSPDKPYPLELPDVYEHADFETAEVFQKRLETLWSENPQGIGKRNAPSEIDEETDRLGADKLKDTDEETERLGADKKKKSASAIFAISIADNISQIVKTLRELTNFFYGVTKNSKREQRDTFILADLLFNALDKLGRKRRSAQDELLSDKDLEAISDLRKKRFTNNLLNIGDILKQLALDNLTNWLALARDYYDSANIGFLRKFILGKILSFLENLSSPDGIDRVKRSTLGTLASIGLRISKAVSDARNAVRKGLNRVREAALSVVNFFLPQRSKRGANEIGEPFSPDEIARVKRGILDTLQSVGAGVQRTIKAVGDGVRNGVIRVRNLARTVVDLLLPERSKRGATKFGKPSPLENIRSKRGIPHSFSSTRSGVQNRSSGVLDLADSTVKGVLATEKKRSVISTFGALLSEFLRPKLQPLDVTLHTKGTLSGLDGHVKSSLDVVHGFLGASAGESREKRDTGDEPLKDILPTSEQLDEFFEQLDDRIAGNFRALEATLEQLRTDASPLNIAPVNDLPPSGST